VLLFGRIVYRPSHNGITGRRNLGSAGEAANLVGDNVEGVSLCPETRGLRMPPTYCSHGGRERMIVLREI
jgi:hypothetical protein